MSDGAAHALRAPVAHAAMLCALAALPLPSHAGCRADVAVAAGATTLSASAANPNFGDDLARIERGLAADVVRDTRARLAHGNVSLLDEAAYAAALAHEGFESEARAVAERVTLRAQGADARTAARAPAILASVYLRLGLIDEGDAHLRQAGELAAKAGDNDTLIATTINRIELARDTTTKSALLRTVQAAATVLGQSARGRRLLGLAIEAGGNAVPANPADQIALLDAAAAIAHAQNDPVLQASVLHGRAMLTESRGDAVAALDGNDRLFSHAATARLSVSPAWLWQRARLLAWLGKPADAEAAYRELMARLKGIKANAEPQLLAAGSSFRERYGEAYLQFADLLVSAAKTREGASRQALLTEARDLAEFTKLVEASDYFRDPCVGSALAARPVESADPDAVTLYPLIFADRLELLVGTRQGIALFSVPVARDALAKTVAEFRALLEKRTTAQFMRPARRLYDFLIRPIEAQLPTGANGTLVVIPDALLRGIPFAALHDGQRFLVERTAVGTTISVSLTDPRRIDPRTLTAAVLGLTEARFGFAGLPAVKEEAGRVGEFLRTAPRLDQAFTREQLIRQLREGRPRVVHIASHGQFSRDPRDSFLLTYDAKLDLDSLRRALEGGSAGSAGIQSLELLMLSACQTATGDDRSAMGLAGVALRSGARSALASLWFVNDESTAELSAKFYQALIERSEHRAAALRSAQRAMIADERFSHPAYWAPFLMIGSWL